MLTDRIIFHGCLPHMRPVIDLIGQLAKVDSVGFKGEDERYDKNATHVVWGMYYGRDKIRELAAMDNVYFAEQAWLPQSLGCYIDPQGVNASSSLKGYLGDHKDYPIRDDLNDKIQRLHGAMKTGEDVAGDAGYLFVPLQSEVDRQIEWFSNIDAPIGHRQEWFIEKLCQVFPDQHIVIKPHPRDPDVAKRVRQLLCVQYHPHLTWAEHGNTYQWLKQAKACVGINSTVLLEALTFSKPVAAMGKGLFSGNGVVLECNGDPHKLRGVLDYTPDDRRIAMFLSLLFDRTIPYAAQLDDVRAWPVCMEVVKSTRGYDAGFVNSKDELIYGGLCEERWREGFPASPSAVVSHLVAQRATGLFIIDPEVDDRLAEFGAKVRTAGMEFILAFYDDPAHPDEARIRRAAEITPKIAVGSGTLNHEWGANTKSPEPYYRMADRYGFEWVCTLNVYTLLQDYMRQDRPLRAALAKHNTLTV